MRLVILCVPGCRNASILRDRIGGLLGVDDAVTLRVVESEDAAVEVGMTGSPTLLVDGVDPFAEPGRSVSLSCRLYRDAGGDVTGAPSVAHLREALGLPAGSDRD
ncbi:hypothetical protein [Pseudofrankia asymbiotica]|uniref:Alkylmercury lyase n=1 Tax=Pseudofrankia asymbiotica TaxID=1834516 RepID=A0A1V2I225_9ACTN|nr:hypothetical protein [Pseudofrankia asymbiotica]ONH23367.1 hypothetical protein BL253_33185 [Pseudofrankia asymbiotica]